MKSEVYGIYKLTICVLYVPYFYFILLPFAYNLKIKPHFSKETSAFHGIIVGDESPIRCCWIIGAWLTGVFVKKIAYRQRQIQTFSYIFTP